MRSRMSEHLQARFLKAVRVIGAPWQKLRRFRSRIYGHILLDHVSKIDDSHDESPFRAFATTAPTIPRTQDTDICFALQPSRLAQPFDLRSTTFQSERSPFTRDALPPARTHRAREARAPRSRCHSSRHNPKAPHEWLLRQEASSASSLKEDRRVLRPRLCW